MADKIRTTAAHDYDRGYLEGLRAAQGDDSERRVYVLSRGMLDRIREFQSENKLASEKAAVSALLASGLRVKGY